MGEQEITMEQEAINVTQGGGAVNSVNGKTGDVILTTSDLENTSDYQTGSEVDSAISTAIGALPTVNDATLTIQKNGASVGTFTANDADNTTINITVPTTAADVSALPASTKYGASISVTIDSSTYVMTTQLKDQDGNNLGSGQTVDLPLESVVVNGSYDSVNKEIVLTLQNGNTIDIPVADLVSGLQTEITSDNKLSADLVDDTSTTNKFVTASEKSTWNAKQDALTAGANITIEEESGTGDTIISATDTTYSDFVGTDGAVAGTAGLVPAPATTDAGKFLKADGTWDTAGGGGPTVVQTTGTSTTDVMSQNAVTSMVFADPGTKKQIQIGASAYSQSGSGNSAVSIGAGAQGYGNRAIAIGGAGTGGNYSSAAAQDAISIATNRGVATSPYSIFIGDYTITAPGERAIAIGSNTVASPAGSVALGAFASATAQGEMNIGVSNASQAASYGYSGTQYRLLTGLYDGQSAHDAATYGQVISYAAINGAGAPTTATEGKYVGQLYYDTTNEAMYFLKTIDTTTTPATYTWEALGGGSSITPVQTPGASTTDVMSQNAVTSMVFADPATQYKIKIGAGTSTSEGNDGIEIGHNAKATAINTTALGVSASATGSRSTAIGQAANAQSDNSLAVGGATVRTGSANSIAIGHATEVGFNKPGAIALGAYSSPSATGEMNIGSSSTSYGYNSSNYRLLTGLYDPQGAHDAATKGYVDPTTDSSAPTSATVGRLGQIFVDTTNADAYMCVDATNPYVWKKLTL